MAGNTTRSEASQSFFVYVKDGNTGVIRRVAIPSDVQIGLEGKPAELQLFGRLSLAAKTYAIDDINKGLIGITNDDTVVALTLQVTPLSGRITCTLPPAPRAGQIHFIKDFSGTAATVPIDVVPSPGLSIDNVNVKTLSDPYGSIALIFLQGQWRMLVAGLGASGGSGAPTNASYVTINSETSLTAERRLSGSTNILMTDNGPGSTVTLDLSQILGGGAGTYSFATVTVDSYGRITNISSGITPPPANASYITAQSEPSLLSERVMSGGLGTVVNDNTTTFNVAINPAVVPLLNQSNTFLQPNTFSAGLSGSLQRLPSGATYLVGVGGISITTGSNGQVFISGSGGSGGGGSAGGGDPGASYVVLGTTASLTNERVLTAGYGLRLQDGGANGNVIISMANSISGAADVSASYVTIGNTGSLPNERALTAGYGLTIQDGGPNGQVIISFSGSLSGSGISGINVSGSGTPVSGNPYANLNFTGAGVSVTAAGNGVVNIDIPGGGGGGGGGSSGEVSASYVVLGTTSSLANERVLTAGPGLTLQDNGANNTVVLGLQTLSSQSAVAYNGFCTGSINWGDNTTWTDFTSVITNFTDSLSHGITRSGSTWTVTATGLYQWHSDFNYLVSNGYLAFRLSGSNGTLLQLTSYDQNVATGNARLQGVVQLTSGSSVKLQYVRKAGSAGTWNSNDPIGGGADTENMRTGEISMFLMADPIVITQSISQSVTQPTTTSGSAYSGYTTASVWWNATGWTPFLSGTQGHFVDLVTSSIFRDGSEFTVSDNGAYYFHASFNAYGSDAYISLRLSGSNGVVLQRSSYRSTPTDQNPVTLDGAFEAVSGSRWRLEYVTSGTVYAWTGSNPLPGGSNMWTGEVTVFKTALIGSSTSGGGGSGTSVSGADISASYVTLGNTGSLPNERALTAGYGINIQDGGSGDKVIISFTGNLSASGGGGGGGGLPKQDHLPIVAGYQQVDQVVFQGIGAFEFNPTGTETMAPSGSTTYTAYFQPIIEVYPTGTIAEVRLYNVTTNTVVTNSTLTGSSLTLQRLRSPNLSGSLPDGSNVYEMQMRVTLAGGSNRATCKGAKLFVTWS